MSENVNHAVEAFFEADEGTVAGQRNDLAGNNRAGRVTFDGGVPGVDVGLAAAEGDLAGFGVDLDDAALQDVADLHVILGAGVTLPRDLTARDQAINTFKVDEDAELDDALDVDFDDLTGRKLLHDAVAELFAGVLEHLAAGDDDAALFGDVFDDQTLDLAADPFLEVVDAAQIDLRSGQESGGADIDDQAALDGAGDLALEGGSGCRGLP